jgi:hypothetical protein
MLVRCMHTPAAMLRFRLLGLLLLMVGCSGSTPGGPGPGDDDDNPEVDAPPNPDLPPLPDSQGRYGGACDGSSGAALDGTHFVGFADEDQRARVFARGAVGAPAKSVSVAGALGVPANAEADVEEAVRAGDRIYLITSHGRKKDGTLDRARYRFAAVQIAGTAPDVTFDALGSSGRLLDDMLVAASWETPDAAAIAALEASSRLTVNKDANLAPKEAGTNIEGMSLAPTAAAPDRMAIGLRNPRPDGKALVVTLLNPAELVTGAPARFGEATRLDLGGLGIRGMAWSEPLASVIVLAGPHDEGDAPFRLYRWSGAAGAAAVPLVDLAGLPVGGHPEAILPYPGTRDVQVLLDGDASAVGGTLCEDLDETAQREFRDVIIHLD